MLPGLHAGLTLTQLGTAYPDQLDDPRTEKALFAHDATCRVDNEKLRCLVGEDL